jgi:hypothetical protein
MNENLYWKLSLADTEPHWLVLNSPDGVDYCATIKADGCVDITHYFNGTRDSHSCYMHYCDLSDEIQRLIALRDYAANFFGEEWEGDRWLYMSMNAKRMDASS